MDWKTLVGIGCVIAALVFGGVAIASLVQVSNNAMAGAEVTGGDMVVTALPSIATLVSIAGAIWGFISKAGGVGGMVATITQVQAWFVTLRAKFDKHGFPSGLRVEVAWPDGVDKLECGTFPTSETMITEVGK